MLGGWEGMGLIYYILTDNGHKFFVNYIKTN